MPALRGRGAPHGRLLHADIARTSAVLVLGPFQERCTLPPVALMAEFA